MVLVQIPMYNEKEVYKLSIGAACRLQWPSDRLIIQVLDDSTDPNTKQLVELECHKWANENVPIKYEIRQNRNGYKAGALREGLKKHYVKQCDYVAIFDADFQPDPDFLIRTVPYLLSNPELALVQARWKFVNANECLMTRLQHMALDYHFLVEQEVGSSTHSFFGFNAQTDEVLGRERPNVLLSRVRPNEEDNKLERANKLKDKALKRPNELLIVLGRSDLPSFEFDEL